MDLDAEALADEIDHRIRALSEQTTQPIRDVRREYSKRIRTASSCGRRTMDICTRLVGDGDEMVVKALSWALRQRMVWDPAAGREFLKAHGQELAASIRREVGNKLETGRKNP